MNYRTYAVVLAAGKGRRMRAQVSVQAAVPKQYMDLSGMPVLAHTLAAFNAAPSVDAIIIAAMEEQYIRNEILGRYPVQKPVTFAEGGEDRQESVWNAISSISGGEIVVIHDGVRPLVTTEVIEKSIEAAGQFGACAAGMPVKDTIKEIDDEGFSVHTPDRSRLWLIQTPQTFKLSLLLDAHKKARQDSFLGTDDSSLVERLGHPVKLIEGGYTNIKITTPEDLDMAAQYLAYRRGKS